MSSATSRLIFFKVCFSCSSFFFRRLISCLSSNIVLLLSASFCSSSATLDTSSVESFSIGLALVGRPGLPVEGIISLVTGSTLPRYLRLGTEYPFSGFHFASTSYAYVRFVFEFRERLNRWPWRQQIRRYGHRPRYG